MTEQDWIDLGKRAVACEGWRWLPGMQIATINKVVIAVNANGWPVYRDGYGRLARVPCAKPDLRDPCTLGGLLALAREAWGRDGVTTEPVRKDDGEWGWGVIAWRWATDGYVSWSYVSKSATEAEALVAALEAAPSKEKSDD